MTSSKFDLYDFLRSLQLDGFGFDPDREMGVNSVSRTGDSPLKYAMSHRNVEAIKSLLENGADPDIQGEDDYTPLHHACVAKEMAIIGLLLKHGASYTIKDRFGCSAADYYLQQWKIPFCPDDFLNEV